MLWNGSRSTDKWTREEDGGCRNEDATIRFGEDQIGQDEEQHHQRDHRREGTGVEAEGVQVEVVDVYWEESQEFGC